MKEIRKASCPGTCTDKIAVDMLVGPNIKQVHQLEHLVGSNDILAPTAQFDQSSEDPHIRNHLHLLHALHNCVRACVREIIVLGHQNVVGRGTCH